jgi:hypothetical protein
VRLLALTSDQASVQLCTCTGELMEQLVSDDPALLDYLRRDEPPGQATRPYRREAAPAAWPGHPAAS